MNLRHSLFLLGALSAAWTLRAGTCVDPAEFGFDPAASASVNAAALQKALDGGKKTVRISRPGVYLVDRSILIDSDTTLDCVPGTVLKKAKKFCNVLVNRGAFTGKRDENIVVRNVEISVNGFEVKMLLDTPARYLRGQLAFYRTRNVSVYGFRCVDYGDQQYCVHFVDFDGVLVDGFDIRGEKDGIHFNCGRDFVCRNGVLSTGDDGIAVNAGDWPDCAPMIGTIENGLAENIRCLYRRRFDWKKNGSIGLVIASCWTDWHRGMRFQRNDMVRHGRNVYMVAPMPFSTNEYVSLTAPVHTNGVWKSPEGICFQWMRGDGATRADAKNIVFRDIDCWYENCLGIGWETGYGWSRAVHPEIRPEDYPVIEVTLERVRSHVPGAPLVRRGVPSDITFRDCSSAGPLAWLAAPACSTGIYPGVKRTVTCTECSFDGEPHVDFRFCGPADTELRLVGNRGTRPVVVENIPPSRVNVTGDTRCERRERPEVAAAVRGLPDPWTQLPKELVD